MLLQYFCSPLRAALWRQLWTDSVTEGLIKAASHAYCSFNGRVSVHDTTGVSWGKRRLPKKEPGGPRAKYVVWTHGIKLSFGVHSTDGVFLSLGTLGPFYKRLQFSTGEPCLIWVMRCNFHIVRCSVKLLSFTVSFPGSFEQSWWLWQDLCGISSSRS